VYQMRETLGNANPEVPHRGTDRDFPRHVKRFTHRRRRFNDETITQYEVAVGARFHPDLVDRWMALPRNRTTCETSGFSGTLMKSWLLTGLFTTARSCVMQR
jgi:hypothetical protein